MDFEYPLLEALAAVAREGSFEAAARSLDIGQSAVSQRIRLLEERTGAVLVVRGRPCVATEYGQHLCRHLDQVQLLEQDVRRSLAAADRGSPDAPAIVRVAVNRDSLATWFPEVVRDAGSKLNLHIEVIPDDQEHTAERLRTGEAMAAVTSEADPLPGCRRFSLAMVEYLAVASNSFIETHLGGGASFESISAATYLVFDRKDTLPLQWVMHAFGRSARLSGHWLPSFSAYLACCLNGSGWGMMPRHSVEDHLERRALRELLPGTSVTVPLYWDSMAPNSGIMEGLSSIVSQVVERQLRPAGL